MPDPESCPAAVTELFDSKSLPTSAEVANAAYDADATLRLVQTYRLTAVDLAHLIDRLPVKPVPW